MTWDAKAMLFALCLLALLFAAQSAVGQTVESEATAGSQSSAGANSGSTAVQGNTQINNFPETPSSQTIRTQSDNVKVHTTPDVFAPMAPSTAPCMIGASMGVGFTGFGISGGTSYTDEECNDRNTAITLHNIGQPHVAEVFLCMQSEEVAAAFRQAGIPCGSGTSMSNLQGTPNTAQKPDKVSWNQKERKGADALPALVYAKHDMNGSLVENQIVASAPVQTVGLTPSQYELQKEQNLLSKFRAIDAGN